MKSPIFDNLGENFAKSSGNTGYLAKFRQMGGIWLQKFCEIEEKEADLGEIEEKVGDLGEIKGSGRKLPITFC